MSLHMVFANGANGGHAWTQANGPCLLQPLPLVVPIRSRDHGMGQASGSLCMSVLCDMHAGKDDVRNSQPVSVRAQIM